MEEPNKYTELIEPNLDLVRQLAKDGATDIEIYTSFGVSETSWLRYKKAYPELKVALCEGRKTVVAEIKRAMLKKALGYTHLETKRVMKETDDYVTITTEEHEKYYPPSEGAAAMILRNYDPEWIDRDQTSIKLRQEELKLKREIAEANNFLEGGEDQDEKV